MTRSMLIPASTLAILASAAHAQFSIDWYTINPGGAASGGSFELYGVIGQEEAGQPLAGGSFVVTGGYLVGGGTAPACPADLDDDGNLANGGVRDNAVTIDDLLYFLAAFENGSSASDLDDNGADPAAPDGGVTIDDLLFFLMHFEGGC